MTQRTDGYSEHCSELSREHIRPMFGVADAMATQDIYAASMPPPAAHCRPQSSSLREWLIQQETAQQISNHPVVIKTEEPSEPNEHHHHNAPYVGMAPMGAYEWMPQQVSQTQFFRSPSVDALPTNLSKTSKRRTEPSATATSSAEVRQRPQTSVTTSDGESSSGASTGTSGLSADETNLEASKLFTHSDLALATIPGCDQFNPASCSFAADELRPQPIIRKRKKVFVPEAAKDVHYWDRRLKNNEAARRSREARRLKENQIALRAAFLENENRSLKEHIDKMADANKAMEEEVKCMRQRLQAHQANKNESK